MDNTRILAVGAFGAIITIFGSIMGWYGFDIIVANQIQEKVSLHNESDSFSMWQSLSVPINFNIYFFNVTNPTEINQGAQPILEQVGPYCYYMFVEKVLKSIDVEKDTITYFMKKRFQSTMDGEACQPHNDFISITNMALMGILKQAAMTLPNTLGLFPDVIPLLFPDSPNSIFHLVRVHEMLFDGVPIKCSDDDMTIKLVCQGIDAQKPATLRKHENGKDFLFATLYFQNDTLEGPYTILRGVKDVNDLGRIISWRKYNKATDIWGGVRCNKINGSDGYILPPVNTVRKRIYSFQGDLCRSVFVEYDKHTETFGIPTIRYCTPPSMLDMSAENKCFRNLKELKEVHEDCPLKLLNAPDGTLSLMPCMGALVYMSWPHFYLAGDTSLLKYAIGLHPEREFHESYLAVEPMTGIPVSGIKRMQMNIFMERLEDVDMMQNISEGMLPLLWIEEGADLPEDFQVTLRSLYSKIKLVDLIKWIVMILGVGCMVIAFLLFLYRRNICSFGTQNSNNNRVNDALGSGVNDMRGFYSRPNNWVEEYNFDDTKYPALYPQLVNQNNKNNERVRREPIDYNKYYDKDIYIVNY